VLLIEILGFKRNPRYDVVLEEKLMPYLKALVSKDCMIFTSGWHGEAAELREFLVQKGIPNEEIFMETNACRTIENIAFVMEALFKRDLKGYPHLDTISRFVFVGEAASEEEVLWLAPRIYKRLNKSGHDLDFGYYPLPLLPPDERIRKRKRLLLNKMSFYLPPLNFVLSMLRKYDIM